jgi:hypothetical protein
MRGNNLRARLEQRLVKSHVSKHVIRVIGTNRYGPGSFMNMCMMRNETIIYFIGRAIEELGIMKKRFVRELGIRNKGGKIKAECGMG